MLEVKWIALGEFTPNPHNARTHSKKQIGQIANSIRQFGWTNPVLVDEFKVGIAGHGRAEAARHLGLPKIPVIVLSGLSETQKRALALADNKIAANAGWDRPKLAAELGRLVDLPKELDFDIGITGFEPAEIDSLFGDLSDHEADPADESPGLGQQAFTVPGDLWVLADHRLLCGDAKREADLAALMNAKPAAMVFTDPPYNVRISSIQGRGKTKHREFTEASGEMSPEAFTRFLVESLSLAAAHSKEGAIHFVCMDWRHIGEMTAAGKQVYGDPRNLIVWAKNNAGQGSFYRSQHELIFVFKNGDAPHTNNIELGRYGRNRSNVWNYPGVNTFRTGRLDDLGAHPTVKPVALVADAMRDCSRRGDIILDPFMGSGTTILAAERVGRLGYGIEIDPLYVDAAIQRWQNFTRRDAILEATGQTFDEIAAERAHQTAGSCK